MWRLSFVYFTPTQSAGAKAYYKSMVEGQLPIRISDGNIILIMKATQNDIPEIFRLQETIVSETNDPLSIVIRISTEGGAE